MWWHESLNQPPHLLRPLKRRFPHTAVCQCHGRPVPGTPMPNPFIFGAPPVKIRTRGPCQQRKRKRGQSKNTRPYLRSPLSFPAPFRFTIDDTHTYTHTFSCSLPITLSLSHSLSFFFSSCTRILIPDSLSRSLTHVFDELFELGRRLALVEEMAGACSLRAKRMRSV